MALGDLNRIKSAFAEATLDPALSGRAPDIVAHETGSFGASRARVAIPDVPATQTVGKALEHYFWDGWRLIEQHHAGVPLVLKTRVADDSEKRMQFHLRPSRPERGEIQWKPHRFRE
jgi:hypothetical protein